MKIKGAIGNALLAGGSLIVLIGVLLIAEFAVRTLTDVNLLGNSSNLFVAGAYGLSHGNAPNVDAVSFEERIHIDENGFRVPSTNASIEKRQGKAIFILGDSVAFGPGVEEEKTFAGRLRADYPSLSVYNAAVIGHWAADYKNVVQHLQLQKWGVQHVFLIFCLNDVSRVSAQAINTALEPSGQQEIERERNINRVSAQANNTAREPSEQQAVEPNSNFVEKLRSFGLIRKVNELLRSRSKLYVLVKGMLTDPQYRYWLLDRDLYLEDNHAGFSASMEHIVGINTFLKQQGIPFTVIVAPYEYQLRNHRAEDFLPQKKLTDYFLEHEIDYIDSTPEFWQRDVESRNFFLPYDPMHFSELGHAVMYEVLRAATES